MLRPKLDDNPFPSNDDLLKLADDLGKFYFRKIKLVKRKIDGIVRLKTK